MQFDAAALEKFLYAVVVIDRESLDIVDANQAACRRYGYSRDQFRAMKITELRVAEERHLAERAAATMTGAPALLGPFRHQTHQGGVIDTEVVSVPTNINGRPSIVALLVDATERVDAQTQARILFEQMPIGAWIHDSDTFEILAVNDAAVAMYGYSREELLSMTLEQLRPDKAREAVTELFRTHPQGEIRRVYRHVRKDGSLIDVEAISTPIPFGRRNARLGAGRDVTQELAAKRALEQAMASLEEAQEITHLGSWRHDFVTNETYRSKELRRILGIPEDDESPGIDTLYRFIDPADRELVMQAEKSAVPGELLTFEHRIVRPDGEVRWVSTRARVQRDASGELTSATGTVRDITEERARDEDLRFLAYHDPLTGLPNRQSIKTILGSAISDGSAAVFFVEFDSLKEINGTFGHDVADTLLRYIAARLETVGGVQACRWSGDQFVVVAPLRETQSHDDVLFRIRTVFAASYEHADQTFFLAPRIGIALYPEHGDCAEALIRNADTAMYEAKRMKRVSAQFRSSMAKAAKERLYIQNGLQEALRSDYLKLAFQPIVSAGTGKIVGAEALIRWLDPDRGVQLPGTFLDIAERTGLIVPIGDWVVSEACRALQVLRGRGIVIPVSVNVAGAQVDTEQILQSIRRWTRVYELPPQALSVEITETGIMSDVEHAISVMNELRRLGVCVALDDFGAGFSSLSHLKSLPLDVMKIDRSLVRGITENDRDRQILTSVLHLAKATGLSVVAEGVETAEQAAMLQSLGCDTLQGFYFSRPLYAAEFYDFAAERAIRIEGP